MKRPFAFARRQALAIAGLLCAGCSQIATVKQTTPRFASAGIQETELAAAANELEKARTLERSDPLRALGSYLAAAQTASNRWQTNPADKQARDLYNFAVARSIDVIERAPLDPWSHPLTVPGPNGEYVVTAIRHPVPDRDPAHYELIPTDSVEIGGTYFKESVTLEGVGAPVVAIGEQEKRDYRTAYTSRRLYGTATAIIRIDGRRAEIAFTSPFETEQITLGGRSTSLAADFTAPAAIALTREHPEKLGLVRLLRPEKYSETAHLTRLQAYDPNRTPVIFVHGLQDTPASWVPMINALRADPEIRRRYQLWVYSYPSGYPFPYSAALFRKDLDGVRRAFPGHKKIVLIGHSMGGLLSRLMITDAGDRIWRNYFGAAPAQTNIPKESRQQLEETLIFNRRTDVARVIFISTPHRGSLMASNWIGRIATSLVKMPIFMATIPFRAIKDAATPPAPEAMELKRIPNSIDTLAPNNRFVIEMNKFPMSSAIPYHSIVGDRGRGDTPESADGVVPYWSSHVEGAQSELIVPSNHSAQQNAQAIAEVGRILKKY